MLQIVGGGGFVLVKKHKAVIIIYFFKFKERPVFSDKLFKAYNSEISLLLSCRKSTPFQHALPLLEETQTLCHFAFKNKSELSSSFVSR